MPVKKDGTGRRWVEMEFVVPGSPEQVWQAVATGPGYAAWFINATIDEHVGGTITFDFGDGETSSGPVTAYEPPVRFGYDELGWADGAPALATEMTVISRSSGGCVVRMVHTLVTDTDDWDDELESFEGGWPTFFDILRIYLENHAGQPGATTAVSTSRAGVESEVWKTLIGALVLTDADVGDRWSAPDDVPRLAGVVEKIEQNSTFRQILLRLAEPVPGVAAVGTCTRGGQVMVNVSLYLYGDSAAGLIDAHRPAWSAWLNELL